ncbi:MAG: DUF2059 domain-containing protein [Sphingomonas bacterium]|nr:DUF2059 domain-containing protein [Sphingomonas bacterium]
MELVEQGFWHGASNYLAAFEDEGERAAATDKAAGLLAKLEPGIRARIPTVMEAYARAFAAKFTAEQLRELVAFASTPTGRHFLASVDALDSDPGVTDAASTLTDDLVPVIMEFQKQACAERAQQRIAMGDKKAVCPLSQDKQTRSL